MHVYVYIYTQTHIHFNSLLESFLFSLESVERRMIFFPLKELKKYEQSTLENVSLWSCLKQASLKGKGLKKNMVHTN